MSFIPFQRMEQRITESINDSDIAYFYDLLLYGEFLTKVVTVFIISMINDDKERTKYRLEHAIIRANAIGDFSRVLEESLTGPPSQLLTNSIRDYEIKELTQRVSVGDWKYDSQKLLFDCMSYFDIEITPLSLKSPLKNWFTAFTVLRNKTKGHGAPLHEACTLACVKLKESIELIINNFYAFNRSWAYLYRNLSGKYRISQLTEHSTEFDFLKKDSKNNLENGIYCFAGSPRKINLFYSTPELNDFFLSNGNLKSETFESISYITDRKEILSAKDYLLPVAQLPSSHTEGLSQLELISNCFTNLPKFSRGYIERSDLEKELKSALMEMDRFPIVTLHGRGGIGKTSLALKVLKEIIKIERYNLILWFSARDIDLLLEGPKQVQTKVLNQMDIAEDYCQLICPEQKSKDRLQYFSNEMTKNSVGKTLYIFDNFETFTNPIEVYEWLNTYIRNPNKILITSRASRDFKADYPIEVLGMTDSECRELISLVANNFNIETYLSPQYIDALISESDGHPYIIKILLGEVAKTKSASKIKRIIADKELILNALFKRTFNTLSPAAKRVFLTLSSWNSLIPVIAVEAVLWRPENEKIDLQGAIEELRKSSFIEVLKEGANSIINIPLAASIFGKSELEVYPEKLKILDDRKLLMEFGSTSRGDISSGIAQKIERKFKSVAKRIKSIDNIVGELPTLEYIASKFPRAWLYIVEIFEEYEDFDKVKYYLREYLKSELPAKDKALYWLKLADICRATDDWDGESHALSELVFTPELPYDAISDAANRINNYFRFHPEAKGIEYKKLLLEKVIEIMEKREAEASATDYSRLAWLLISNGNEDAAKKYTQIGLQLEPENAYCQKLGAKFNLLKKYK